LNINDTRKIYSHILDDYSKYIYEKRVMHSLTGNYSYMNDICNSIINKDIMDNIMNKLQHVKEKLIVRGAGNDYHIIKRLYPDFDFYCFCDNDATKIGTSIDNKEVISPKQFYNEYSEYFVLINSAAANKEIYDEFKSNNIQDDHIFNMADCYQKICDKQYFEKNIVTPTQNEIFIDGGCYDGRTIKGFINWCNNNYSQIYSFEPDKTNYSNAKDNIKYLSNITLINKGLWNEDAVLKFSNGASQGAMISDDGDNQIETTTIDKVVGLENVTFIKLDVEGAEYNALLGAQNTIIKNHPKLAISIYHKPEDIFELPELILSLDDSYRFYLRHYQLSPNETILYCI